MLSAWRQRQAAAADGDVALLTRSQRGINEAPFLFRQPAECRLRNSKLLSLVAACLPASQLAAVCPMMLRNITSNEQTCKSCNSRRFSDIPDGFAGLAAVPTAGLAQIFFFCGVCELAIWPASNYSGDYGCGYGRPFVPNVLEGEELKFKLDMEINQGRAAMLGILGAMVGEGVTGQTLAEQYASGNVLGYGPP